MEWDSRRIGHRLKLRDLNVLMTVARCGSMEKPPLSSQCDTAGYIEGDRRDGTVRYGVRLLDRSPLGVEPTMNASALSTRCNRVRRVTAGSQKNRGDCSSKTRACADWKFGRSRFRGFVAAIINRLSRQYPRMSFYVSAEESGMTYRALEERKVDLDFLALFRTGYAIAPVGRNSLPRASSHRRWYPQSMD